MVAAAEAAAAAKEEEETPNTNILRVMSVSVTQRMSYFMFC